MANKDKTAEIRVGRLIFNEPKLNFQIHPLTIKELARFHELKHTTQIQNSIQLEVLLRSFDSLIGLLIQESEKPLAELSVFVKEILCPTGFDEHDPWNDILLPSMLEAVINEIALRKSYGVRVEAPETGEGQLCDSMLVFRWDVKNVEAIFPAPLIPAILRRRQERERLQEEAQRLFNELPSEERIWIASQNASRKKRKLESAAPALLDEKDVVIEAKPYAIKSPTLKKERPEKPAVKPVPAEPKLAKPGASITGFFSPVKRTNQAARSCEEPANVSDYMKYFHPFHVKHNTTIAKPVPLETRLAPSFDSILSKGCSGDVDAHQLLSQVQRFLVSQKQQLVLSRRGDFKLDESDEESLLFISGLRPKLLHFHENYRPAFFGAWLKESAIISPRNFLKKDSTLLDYSVDSEEEWVDEEEGELLDDSDEEDEEEEEDLSKDGSDSENDDWLVEEDEELENEASLEPSHDKPTTKLHKNVVLKPMLFGVAYDRSQVASFFVNAGTPLISLSYQLSHADCKFPLDPFGPVIEPMPQQPAPTLD